MSGTYKATGINLKGMPFGETDRLLTVLTREYGLLRAIAPGARKHESSLRGRSGLFVVNQLLIVKGRSLDKITQAETLESFAGLSQDLAKLTASQYLAELALYQALSDQPQEELFALLCDSLRQLEQLPSVHTLPFLTQTAFQLLALAGVAPQVHACCVTQEPLIPNFASPGWFVGFSVAAGGTVMREALQNLPIAPPSSETTEATSSRAAESTGSYSVNAAKPTELRLQLDAIELALLQELADRPVQDAIEQLPDHLPAPDHPAWRLIEQILRHCAEYYFERPIRSASLIDVCFKPVESFV
jgi:DNA repair protein RecO (recombination protein O)